MCRLLSGFAAIINGEVRLWTSRGDQSHTAIAREHVLRDSGLVRLYAWECCPRGGQEVTTDTSDWPVYWDSDATAGCRDKPLGEEADMMIAAIRREARSFVYESGSRADSGWYLRGATCTGQSGGECWVYAGGAATGQSGGECWVYAGGAATGQSGGRCVVYAGGAATGQSGGRCWVYAGGTATGQSGGDCWVYAGGTATGQSGGECWVYAGGTATGQSGGKCVVWAS